MTDLNRIWNEILAELEKGEKALSAVSFEVWIKTLEPVCIDTTGNLVLMAPTISNRNLVANRYTDSILAALSKTSASALNGIVFISAEEKGRYISNQSGNPTLTLPSLQPAGLPVAPTTAFNPKFTFDNFVIGKNNQFAAASAKAVAEQPSQKFNPLFIHGTVGLGKTHLMHAIGNHLKHERPDLKVLYVSCDRFRNELIEAIRGKGSTQEFREKYRLLDVLLIDDIQFIANQTSTQEEFFHTFNDLHLANKQIIISSDRHARDIAPLEERLRTRFVSGMVADIQPPDIELRIAILQKKAQQKGCLCPPVVLNMIAEKVQNNIRELEGLLERVIFYAQLAERPLDIEVAKEALNDYTEDIKDAINEDTIIDVVCSYFNIDRTSITGKKKNKEIVEPRQICIYLITEFLPLPLVSIGQIFGGRDHTTVMHARDKIAASIKEGGRTANQVKDLKNMILKK